MNHRLSRWSLPGSSLNHMPHNHFIDCIRSYSGTRNRLSNGDCTKLRGGDGRESTEIPADWSAAGAENNWNVMIRHFSPPCRVLKVSLRLRRIER